MRKILFIFMMLVAFLFNANISYAHEIDNLSAQEALTKLKKGNKRFVEQKLKHPDIGKQRRKEMIKGQHPFVAILSCSAISAASIASFSSFNDFLNSEILSSIKIPRIKR